MIQLSYPFRQSVQRRLPLISAAVAVAALVCTTPASQAQQTGALDPKVFPPTQLFRELQLETMACGRDNTAQACDKARAMADPLMDHPMLSASCKDTAWDIRERAVVAQKNSYSRRETLNKDATDLVLLCKPATKPLGSGGQASKEEPKKQGGLGGLLRGLGIGGGNGK